MKILCYPDHLRRTSKLAYTCKLLGIERTNNIHDDYDIAIFWSWSNKDDVSVPNVLKTLPVKVINVDLNNIYKDYIDEIHLEAFGYNTAIDPFTFEGTCVAKDIRQCTKLGRFVKCPVKKKRPWNYYQKFIDSTLPDNKELMQELRIPIFNDKIPCVFDKTKPIDGRFGISRPTKIVFEDNISIYLSEEEQSNIIRFCKLLGAEYCELDALRCNDTGKLYVIDVNNVAGHDLFRLFPKPQSAMIQRLFADYFQAEFIDKYVDTNTDS